MTIVEPGRSIVGMNFPSMFHVEHAWRQVAEISLCESDCFAIVDIRFDIENYTLVEKLSDTLFHVKQAGQCGPSDVYSPDTFKGSFINDGKQNKITIG